MVKGNIHKKITNEDKFARKFYCEHARLNSIRFDKRFNKRKFSVEMFQVGQRVNITGLTIGKGFTGNVKKNNFSRGAMTHGSKHHRAQGSLGSGTTPGRVFPGKRMSSQLGVDKRTILGLEIIDIDEKENIILVKGAIPGKSGNLVSITAKK